MPITLNGTTGVVTPGATVGSITGVLKATSGVVSQAVAGSDYGQLTLATAQTASGTAVDFTGIPSWAKRITVMFVGVSTNGSSPVMVQLGTSSGVVTSGYLGSANGSNFTTGFTDNFATSIAFRHGMHIITLAGSNTWVASVTMGASGTTPVNNPGGFSVALGGTLDRLRVTTQNGTDTFDAGTINISYE